MWLSVIISKALKTLNNFHPAPYSAVYTTDFADMELILIWLPKLSRFVLTVSCLVLDLN